MNKYLVLAIANLALGSVAHATGASAPADAPAYKEPITDTELGDAPKVGHRLVFEHPFILDAKKIPISVERVESEYDDKLGQFKISDQEKQTRYCNLRLAIQGRDIAVNNTQIGEHYFGKMQLSCAQSGGNESFTTTFSRVFVLGIRNCVESDTMVDRDYCNLYVIAFRKKTDLKASNGDLIQDTGNRLEKYVVTSSGAQTNIVKGGFLPAGLNEDTIDGFQSFKISIGKGAGEYFIPSTSNLTSIGGGKSYYMQVLEDSTRQDQVENEVKAKLDTLETLVNSIRGSAKPQDFFADKNAEYFKLYAETAKTLLEVVHPVTFYRFEAQLKGIENQVIELVKTWDTSIRNQDNFLSKYSSALGDYDRLRGYYSVNENSTSVDYTLLGGPNLIAEPKPAAPAVPDVRSQQSFVGKIIESSGRSEYDSMNISRDDCYNYINENATIGTIDLFQCTPVRTYKKKDKDDKDLYFTQNIIQVK